MDEVIKDLYLQFKQGTIFDYIILAAITLFSIYIFYKIRLRNQIESYDLENKKTEMSILKTYLEYYKAMKTAKVNFITLLTKRGESKTEKGIISITQELSNQFHIEVFPEFRNLLECAKIRNRYKRNENRLFIEEEIIPFLEVSKMFFSLANEDGLDHSTLIPILQFGKENLSLFDWQLKKKLTSCIQDVENGQSNQKK